MNRIDIKAALADPKKRRKLLRNACAFLKALADEPPHDFPTEGYRVTYEIDVDAESPMDAAIKVAGIMRDPYYQPEFAIRDHRTGETFEIDLENPE